MSRGTATQKTSGGPFDGAQQRATDQMRGVRNAGAEIPQTAEPVAAFDRREHAARRHAMGRGKVTVGAEQFALCLFGPMRRNQKRMRGTERKAPAGRRMAMRYFEHGTVKGYDVELVAAEHARLHRPIETGVQERLVQLRRITATLVIFRLLLAQQRLERRSARDQFLRREIRLRDRHDSPRRLAVQRKLPPSLADAAAHRDLPSVHASFRTLAHGSSLDADRTTDALPCAGRPPISKSWSIAYSVSRFCSGNSVISTGILHTRVGRETNIATSQTREEIMDSPRSVSRRKVLKGGAAAGLAAASMPTLFRPAVAVPETVKIGLVGPKTGPLALFYEEMSWAIEHAKKSTGNSITINGTKHPLEIVAKDSQSNPNRASRSYPRAYPQRQGPHRHRLRHAGNGQSGFRPVRNQRHAVRHLTTIRSNPISSAARAIRKSRSNGPTTSSSTATRRSASI